jgi:hypothetical protein
VRERIRFLLPCRKVKIFVQVDCFDTWHVPLCTLSGQYIYIYIYIYIFELITARETPAWSIYIHGDSNRELI